MCGPGTGDRGMETKSGIDWDNLGLIAVFITLLAILFLFLLPELAEVIHYLLQYS